VKDSNELDKVVQKDAEQRARAWWRWFWITIALLLLAYMSALYLGNYKQSQNLDINTKEGRANYSQKMKSTLSQISPELLKYISALSKESKEKIRERIHQEVLAAYEPVYSEGIDNFTNFHYSISGEYIELYNASADGTRSYFKMQDKENFNLLVYDILFESTGFEKHLEGAFLNINNFAVKEILNNINKLHKKVQNDLNTTEEESRFLVAELLKISSLEMKSRFKNEVSAGFRAGGVTTGAFIGAVASKQIAKMFTKKLATKAAIKVTSKTAGAMAGATAGGVEGLICGPGAPVCSTAGAIAGAIVGWFATDAIVIKVDKYYHEDSFKKELRDLIEKQQLKTQEQLYEVYINSLEKINKESEDKLKSFKHTLNKEHL
jgi:uncharacterized protein YsxB (DUF464 family)